MTFVPDVAHRVSNGQSTPANDPDRLSLVAYTVSGSSDVLHTEELAQPIIGRHGDPGAWRGRGAELGEPEVANALRSSGDGHVGDQMGYVLAAHPVAVSENQRGEVLETDYAHQLTSGGGKPGQGYPAVRQGMAVRRLTPLECERLQGFPDGWTDVGISDSARYRLLGNAVAVPVAEWIGRRIVEAAV
jgi:site-specific DNA-cytosine methylase